MKLLIILLAFSMPTLAQTSYYKCTGEHGRPIFSERPCGADAEAASIDSATITGSVAPDDFGAISDSRKIREREHDIDFLEDRIERLEREREARLGSLENAQRYANNNLAGAQYRESLATEMQSVNSEYQAKIEREQSKIDRYRDEIDRLREEP